MYDYKIEREKIFTEQGQKLFLSIRDNVKKLISQSGACTMGKVMSIRTGISSSSWEMMACVDRLVELGEIKEIPTKGPAQHRVFVSW